MDGSVLPPEGEEQRLRRELAATRDRVEILLAQIAAGTRDYDALRRAGDELREGLDRIADRDLSDGTLTFRAHAEAMQADARRAITRAEGG